VLLKIKGRIIGHTLVQDYVFQPVECNQMSLYDWIHFSEVEKHPNKIEQNSFDDNINEDELNDENNIYFEDEKDKVTFHHFLGDHPLHHSHHVMLLDNMHG
jgi:hypothetical protein